MQVYTIYLYTYILYSDILKYNNVLNKNSTTTLYNEQKNKLKLIIAIKSCQKGTTLL